MSAARRAPDAVACNPARRRRGIANLDQRVGQRVFEDAIAGDGRGRDEVRNGAGVADPSERFGGDALDGGATGFQRGHERAAAPPRRATARRNRSPPAARCRRDRPAPSAPPRAPRALRCASAPRRRCAAPRPSETHPRFERAPERPASPPSRTAAAPCSCTAGRASSSSFVRSAGVIVFQASERPRGSATRRRAFAPHAIDRAEHVRLGELRRRATELVPGAGVDHEQAAIGVFDHVGRMEVAIVRDEKVGVASLERRAVRLEHVARHLAQVEHRREEVVAVVRRRTRREA